MKRYLILFLLVFSFVYAQSGETVMKTESGSYLALTPEVFQARLESAKVLLVNTHIPYEGELHGTELFLPFDELENYVDILPRDKNTEILLYCRSGRMSTLSAQTLVKLGYTNVKKLTGGIIAWEEAGFTLEQRP